MITLEEIAGKLDGVVQGKSETPISGISTIQEAVEGQITFLLSSAYLGYLHSCRASGIIVGHDVPTDKYPGKNFILVKDPSLAYARTAELFQDERPPERGVDRLAFVSDDARVSEKALIGPYVYIGPDAVIAEDVIIHPFTYIGKGVTVGEGSTIYPNVTVYDGVTIGRRVTVHAGAVIGSDGFGYVWDGSRHKKIPQLGTVRIEDDAEIGANTTVDRASLGTTVIGEGVKIDNLVMIAHNVSIGANSIIVSQVGIAGSTTVGKNVILAGQVGVRDHVTIGDNVRAGGGTGITKDVPENATILGTPHMPHRDWLKLQGYLRRLPKLFGAVARLEKKLGNGGST